MKTGLLVDIFEDIGIGIGPVFIGWTHGIEINIKSLVSGSGTV